MKQKKESATLKLQTEIIFFIQKTLCTFFALEVYHQLALSGVLSDLKFEYQNVLDT